MKKNRQEAQYKLLHLVLSILICFGLLPQPCSAQDDRAPKDNPAYRSPDNNPPSVAPAVAPAPPPPYSFEIQFEAETEVDSAGMTAKQIGSDRAFVSMPGGERTACQVASAMRSFAQGEANGTTQSLVEDGATIVLTTTTQAIGGFRLQSENCTDASLGRVTSAAASATATGRITIQFRDDAPPGRRYYVDQQASGDTAQLSDARIVDQFGQDVPPDGPGERPVITSGPAKIYTAIFSLRVGASSTGAGEQQTGAASITGRVLLESAPVSFAPYMAGATEAGIDDFLEVAALMINPPEGLKFICTAILVTPTTAITAAHCVEPHWSRINDSKTALLFVGKNIGGTARDWVSIKRADYPYNPMAGAEYMYDPITKRDDMAILYLERPVVGVTSFAALTTSPEALTAAYKKKLSVTLVGFGAGYDGITTTPQGVKRFAAREISKLDDRMLYFNPTQYKAKGMCKGDSGGPTYLSGTSLVAVTSNGPENYCDGSGFVTRVDAMLKWLSPRIDCLKFKRIKLENRLTYICIQ